MEKRPPNDRRPQVKFILLETCRKNGLPVATPMWFIEHEGKICMRTDENSPKIRRLRINSSVRLAPCTARGRVTGPWRNGTARLRPASEMIWMLPLIRKKYGLFKHLVDLRNRIMKIRVIVIEIDCAGSSFTAYSPCDRIR